MLFLTNSLTGKKEKFELQNSKKNVSLYVCGITPYDFAHIGHGRCYVTFDLLYRMLTFLDYDVEYCRNFTDIDDKILKRAEEELGDITRYGEITKKYIKAFWHDMHFLGCITPQQQPCVTEVIPEIITFITSLIEKNVAYVHEGSVYFRVLSYRQYGKLSKQDIKELQSGARVEISDYKENPLDFALWKRDDIVGFDSPWGQGRPGWHIECSTMIEKVFGKTIDIHGGGMDLIFPHHENEIAQSESLYSRPFVRYWMHNAFVQINKEKMSKSLQNFFTLQDIFKDFDPMVVRFYFLKHHYRNPLDFSFDDMQASLVTYKKLINIFSGVCIKSVRDINQVKQNYIVLEMLRFLEDDLNTSGALGILFDKLSLLHDDDQAKTFVKYFLIQVFGLTLDPLQEKTIVITPEIQGLIDQREKARLEKNWKLADQLRDQLTKLGIQLHDKKMN